MQAKLQNQRKSLRLDAQMLQDVSKVKGKNFSDKIKRLIGAGLENKSVDNADYSELVSALFELKRDLAPIGSNLNQLALFFNQGSDAEGIENIDELDKLREEFKILMKLMKRMEKELKIK